MNPFKISSKLVMNVVGGVVALGLMLGSAAPAFAQTDTPPVTPDPARQAARLERAYAKAQEWLGHQADRLAKTGEIETKVQEFIDQAKAEGKDTSGLEAALASASAKVDQAQTKHAEAAAILSTHAGFDDAGKVTDVTAARQTLESAGRALRDAHRLLQDAAIEMRRAIHDFRQANRPAPQPIVAP
jgi:hypothetical protein